MCRLNRKTKRKSATIYKVVLKVDDKYYSYFAGTEIKIGKVEPQTSDDNKRRSKMFYGLGHEYRFGNPWYNEHMVGRTSGFTDRLSAKIFLNQCSGEVRILKLNIGGEIWEGSGDSVGKGLEKSMILAGDEILSFEEK